MRGKKCLALLLALLLVCIPIAAHAEEDVGNWMEEGLPAAVQVVSIDKNSLPARSVVLMEQHGGTILYEQNADEPLPPASVTKIMTLLLAMEALEDGKISLDDTVSTSENAASMGGSQIWLKVGEEMTVHDLLKAVAISSANDASVALGEHISGSEAAFIDLMNQRAAELGMYNTHFVNCTGLDAPDHLTTARDIAIMSRELMQYPLIAEYSTVWMDSLRGGATELVNTNRLVRFYDGCTGLKTGTTNGAGSCLSATATRNDLSLIAVVMGANTSDERFAGARGLLDYGFANYMSFLPAPVDEELKPVRVMRGVEEWVLPVCDLPDAFVLEKMDADAISYQVTLAEDVQAPVEAGQVLGKVEIVTGDAVIGSYPLRAEQNIERMTFSNAFRTLGVSLLRMRSAPKSEDTLPQPSNTLGDFDYMVPGAELDEDGEVTVTIAYAEPEPDVE